MRRPSILFLNRVYAPERGATGRVLRDLARRFAREGWRVTVITTGPKSKKERDGSVRIVRLKGPKKPSGLLGYGWAWIRMLYTAMRLRRRDLVVTMTDPPMLVVAGGLIARFKKSRHIHWCQDLYPDILPALGFKVPDPIMERFKKLSRQALRSCDRVVVIGRCMAGHLAEDGIDPARITMIPNWPDFELVRPAGNNNNGNSVEGQITNLSHHSVYKAAAAGAKPYRELLKNGMKFKVLYAGNIGRAHPVDTILDAAEKLNGEYPEIEFIFAGDGPRFDKIAHERTVRNLDNIRLLPHQPPGNLRSLMESGDVHLVSMTEHAAGHAVPSKIYAAMAVQRPCIFVGPQYCEAAQVIYEFGAGIVVPQGNADDLARAILHFRMNGDEWFAAQNGAANAGKVFMPKQSIRAWMDRAWNVIEGDLRQTGS